MVDLQFFPDGANAAVALLKGELVGTAVADVSETLEEAVTGESGRLIVDLSELSSLDSSGLAALIHLTNRARLTGGKIVLINPSAFVRGVFRTTRLDRWFDMASDMAAAREMLREQ